MPWQPSWSFSAVSPSKSTSPLRISSGDLFWFSGISTLSDGRSVGTVTEMWHEEFVLSPWTRHPRTRSTYDENENERTWINSIVANQNNSAESTLRQNSIETSNSTGYNLKSSFTCWSSPVTFSSHVTVSSMLPPASTTSCDGFVPSTGSFCIIGNKYTNIAVIKATTTIVRRKKKKMMTMSMIVTMIICMNTKMKPKRNYIFHIYTHK